MYLYMYFCMYVSLGSYTSSYRHIYIFMIHKPVACDGSRKEGQDLVAFRVKDCGL